MGSKDVSAVCGLARKYPEIAADERNNERRQRMLSLEGGKAANSGDRLLVKQNAGAFRWWEAPA